MSEVIFINGESNGETSTDIDQARFELSRLLYQAGHYDEAQALNMNGIGDDEDLEDGND